MAMGPSAENKAPKNIIKRGPKSSHILRHLTYLTLSFFVFGAMVSVQGHRLGSRSRLVIPNFSELAEHFQVK